jgi:hypothetical protein
MEFDMAGEVMTEDEDTAEKKVVRLFQKKQLIDAVVASSGVKKKAVRPVVDAVLAEIASALARGEGLSVPPLGKLTVGKTREGVRNDVLVLKLRRPKPGEVAEDEALDSEDATED